MGSSETVLLTVAYDGTEFSGWQSQPGIRTVEGVLTSVVSEMCGAQVRLRGASRTDAGVHALGQPVAFDSPRAIDAHCWLRGLNQGLPNDIRIRAVGFREAGFDPRFRASLKQYRYVLSLGPAVDPVFRNQVWHLDARHARPPPPHPRRAGEGRDWLDIDSMGAAASILLGTHDFKAFQAANDDRDSTTRTLRRVDIVEPWAANPELIAIVVEGTAFLKNMVRILAGTLVEVGRERRTVSQIGHLLEPDATRPLAGPTAPASGLTLVSVELNRSPPPGTEVKR